MSFNFNNPNETSNNDSTNLAGNSSTWHSQGNSAVTKLQRLHGIGSHIGVTNSPFFPKSVQEHHAHQMLYQADQTFEQRKLLENRIAEAAAITSSLTGLKGEDKDRERARLKVKKLMGGIGMWENAGGSTTVLSKKSIWTAGAEETSVCWPTREECKYEGEQQARQGLPRKLPLPKENKLKEIDRSEMMCSGQAEEVAKMERGERVMPWRTKEVSKVEKFDETELGRRDRVKKGLERYHTPERKRVEQIDDAELREKGWLGDLLDEL